MFGHVYHLFILAANCVSGLHLADRFTDLTAPGHRARALFAHDRLRATSSGRAPPLSRLHAPIRFGGARGLPAGTSAATSLGGEYGAQLQDLGDGLPHDLLVRSGDQAALEFLDQHFAVRVDLCGIIDAPLSESARSFGGKRRERRQRKSSVAIGVVPWAAGAKA